MMHVALDATPLLGARTGIGHYVAHLTAALARRDDVDVVLTAFTWRGQAELATMAAQIGGVVTRSRRAPARLLRAAWARSEFPPVDLLSGPADVFHGTNFVLPPARKAAGVVTVHDLAFVLHPDTVDRTTLAYRSLVPRALDRAKVVVTPSEATADGLAEVYGVERDRVVVTPLGVDPIWAKTKPPSVEWLGRHGIPPRYVLFVGTLEPRKNVPDLIAAHRMLRDDDPETPRLVLAGAAGWGEVATVRDDVTWPGYLPQEDLRALVAGASALAMPSRHEGFGLPALEALACGVPVVASDIAVLREVTGGLAQYAPVGDIPAIARALRAAIDTDTARLREARRAWAARSTWARCADATIEAYRRALAA